MINIIGGKYKRKKLEVPSKQVRPTSAKKREAIFSVLESYAIKEDFDLYNNKCFIDLFAGSGSLGLESISRGAFFSYFYENQTDICEILLKNCKNLCEEEKFEIICRDITLLKKININYYLSAIFIDPPYKFKFFNEILLTIINSNILKKNSFIIIETSKVNVIEIPKQLIKINDKIYGNTKIIFLKLR